MTEYDTFVASTTARADVMSTHLAELRTLVARHRSRYPTATRCIARPEAGVEMPSGRTIPEWPSTGSSRAVLRRAGGTDPER